MSHLIGSLLITSHRCLPQTLRHHRPIRRPESTRHIRTSYRRRLPVGRGVAFDRSEVVRTGWRGWILWKSVARLGFDRFETKGDGLG
jgi:hypothetical protein